MIPIILVQEISLALVQISLLSSALLPVSEDESDNGNGNTNEENGHGSDQTWGSYHEFRNARAGGALGAVEDLSRRASALAARAVPCKAGLVAEEMLFYVPTSTFTIIRFELLFFNNLRVRVADFNVTTITYGLLNSIVKTAQNKLIFNRFYNKIL